VHHLRAGLLSLGHRVTVLAFSVHPSESMVSAYRIEGSWQSKAKRLLMRLARSDHDPLAWGPVMIADTINRVNHLDPFDVVEMEESFGWFAEVQRRVPVPVVVKLHGPAFLTQIEQIAPSSDLLRRIEREGAALQESQFVFAPSSITIASTFERYGITSVPRVVIRNPVSAVEDKQYLWTASACNPKQLIFVGRFERIKGADFLLKAFRLMLETDPSLRLLFVGPHEGAIHCDGVRMTLAECIDAWFGPELTHAVEVCGTLPVDEIQTLRVRSALSLVCSRWENQPNTALEAMAQGCPVLAVGVGGIGEVIVDGVTGVLTPPSDAAAFARSALKLLAEPATAAAIGAAARSYVMQAHTPKFIAQQTIAFYQRACEEFQRRS
jgi:glycosyltransferase involved in cell wall biosynthesis